MEAVARATLGMRRHAAARVAASGLVADSLPGVVVSRGAHSEVATGEEVNV